MQALLFRATYQVRTITNLSEVCGALGSIPVSSSPISSCASLAAPVGPWAISCQSPSLTQPFAKSGSRESRRPFCFIQRRLRFRRCAVQGNLERCLLRITLPLTALQSAGLFGCSGKPGSKPEPHAAPVHRRGFEVSVLPPSWPSGPHHNPPAGRPIRPPPPIQPGTPTGLDST
jgi:hypothetical protein